MQLAADQVSGPPAAYVALARQLREHGDPCALPMETRWVPRQRRAPAELLAPVCIEKQRGKMRSYSLAYWSYECGEVGR